MIRLVPVLLLAALCVAQEETAPAVEVEPAWDEPTGYDTDYEKDKGYDGGYDTAYDTAYEKPTDYGTSYGKQDTCKKVEDFVLSSSSSS